MQQLPRPNNDKDSGQISVDNNILEKSPWHQLRYICHLNNIRVKKINRTEKRGVMDEKFCLLFESTFQICNIPVNVSKIQMLNKQNQSQEHFRFGIFLFHPYLSACLSQLKPL